MNKVTVALVCLGLLGVGFVGGAKAKSEAGLYEIHEYESGKHFTLTESQSIVGFSCTGNGRNATENCYVLTVSH